MIDRFAQLFDIDKAGSLERLAAQNAKPAFNLVASGLQIVPAWLSRVRGLPGETRPGGHGKARPACGSVEVQVIDDSAFTHR